MLGEAMKARVDVLASSMTPKGGHPPFTRHMTASEALEWWLKHRYDQQGLTVMQHMQPVQVAQLDAWLAQAISASNGPAVQEPPVNVGQQVLRQAMGQERRIEGPPVGDQVS